MSGAKPKVSLVSALRGCVLRKDYGTGAFILILILVSVLLFSLRFCPWTQRQIMEKFHLKSPSFARFAVFQFIPSMYNFSNEILITGSLVKGGQDALYVAKFQVNHYPLRMISFGSRNRSELIKSGAPRFAFIRSRYNGHTLDSIYALEPQGYKLYVRLVQ